MADWIDTCRYQRGEDSQTPNESTLSAGGLKVTVHHYMGCGDTWFVSSKPDVVYQRRLMSITLPAAKKEAEIVIMDILEQMMDGIRKAGN